MHDDYKAILDCYKSEQMSERQWQGHLADPLFAIWLRGVLAKSAR